MEENLTRLQLERIDVVYIHDPDDHYEQALKDAYPTLDDLRRKKVIGAIGVRMNQADLVKRNELQYTTSLHVRLNCA